jgi:hypothetical protein
MDKVSNTTNALEHHIYVTLLYASLRNDANRIFAGIRRPSKNTREILDNIEKLRLERIGVND